MGIYQRLQPGCGKLALFHPFHNFFEGFKAFRVQDEAKATGIIDLGQIALLKF